MDLIIEFIIDVYYFNHGPGLIMLKLKKINKENITMCYEF